MDDQQRQDTWRQQQLDSQQQLIDAIASGDAIAIERARADADAASAIAPAIAIASININPQYTNKGDCKISKCTTLKEQIQNSYFNFNDLNNNNKILFIVMLVIFGILFMMIIKQLFQ